MNIAHRIAENKRKAISQSMDLFIIIAAVLAVGGIVAAAVYGLAGSATSNSSIQIVGASLKGSSTASTIGAFSMTIKNTGSSSITCASPCNILMSASPQPALGTAPAFTSLTTSSGTWTATASAAFSLTSNSFTLAPGAQVTISFASLSSTGGTNAPTSGTQVTVNANFASASASVTITAQ